MKVFCRYCKEKGERDEMGFDVYGKKTKSKKYYHPECKEKVEQERLEIDELYETIKKAHKVKEVVDKKFWSKIKDIRNGDYNKGGRRLKNKDGYSYPLISYTYKTYWNEMNRAIKWSQKQGGCQTVSEQIHYGLGVIIKHLEDARIKKENVKTHKKNNEAFKKNVIDIDLQNEQQTTKKKNEKHKTDISDFL